MKNIKKLDPKKLKAKDLQSQNVRRELSDSGTKAVVGCPELSRRK